RQHAGLSLTEAVRKVTPPSGFNLTVPKTRPPHATWEYSWPPRMPELGRRLDQGFYAARSYSLMTPPRTGRRLIRCWDGPAAGWSGLQEPAASMVGATAGRCLGGPAGASAGFGA